jgi:tetratricopeptide (TPR) repeat protein
MRKPLQVKRKHFFCFRQVFLYCVLVFVSLPGIIIAQDKIYRTDSTLIQAKVQEVGDAEIKYKKFSNLNGPVYSVKKSDVWMIIYENGEKEVYNKPMGSRKTVITPPANPAPRRSYINAVDEANNEDLIITVNGENIYCTIDFVNTNLISYHIKRRGMDPKGSVTFPEVVKYFFKQQWYYGFGAGASADKARDLILEGNINDAIAAYFHLISSDTANANLLAEDAYALALGGIYDAALMRLDRSWSLVPNSLAVNYFTAQVFALMGYDDLAAIFWKSSGNYQAPEWISPASAGLLQKFRTRTPVPAGISREELIADFKLANDRAAKNLNFQSIALFHMLTDLCPGEYILYAGYSIPLERTGALEKSEQVLGKAIELVGNNADANEKRQFLEQRLVSIHRKVKSSSPETLPGLSKNKGPDTFRPQMMAFAGGMFAPSMINVNGRIGYYLSGSSNASFDFGVTSADGITSGNVGLSAYMRKNILVAGAGLMLNAGSSTNFAVKISVGISKIGKDQASSVDVFLDGTVSIAKSSVTTVSLSIGKSLYFGKRK